MSFHQPPGPYGPQGGASGHPGYGYPPQPPPPGPYGQPQGHPPPQGAGPGYPPQGPYGPPGYPAPPPPPPGSGKGKAIALAFGAVAVVGAVVGGILFFVSGDDPNDAVADDGPHRLELPTSLGEFRGNGPVSDDAQSALVRGEAERIGIRNAQGTAGSYTKGSPSDPAPDSTMTMLTVSGAWGDIDDPAATLDRMFDDDITRQAGVQVEGDPLSISPKGLAGALMKCQRVKVVEQADSMSAVVCKWADRSTVGQVVMSRKLFIMDVEAAEKAAEIRKVARVKQ